MEYSKLNNVWDDLKKYDIFAKDNDYITVSEWESGEGYYINISDSKQISLSHGEIDAINYLVMSLRFKERES